MKWWTQREICDAISGYTYIDDDRNNCAAIGDDQRALNENAITEKIVITKKHCFKIATEEEYWEARTAHINRIKSQVAQVQAMDQKYNRNGQGKLFNNVLNELTKANEQFHETFIEQEEKETFGNYVVEENENFKHQEAKITDRTVCFVNLLAKKIFIVHNVIDYELNNETHIAYIDIEATGQTELLNIHCVETLQTVNMNYFFKGYERVVL